MLKKSPKMLALPQKAYAAIPVIALALAPGAAFAQQAQDDGIVVTARLDDPAQGATGGVRSLVREDIEAQAPVSLLETFALLPGIDAFEKGGAGGGSYLAIRGGEPNFTLVTINGVRVNDPLLSSGGGFDFTLLGTGDAARVDVLSGPSSTIYGADALSGVVSIRFDAPRDKSGASARMGLGSGGRFEVGGRAFVSGKAGSLVLAGSARDTGDFLSGTTSQGQSAMISAAPNLGDAISLDLFGFYGASQGRGFPEDSGGPELAVIRDPETRDREQIALGATVQASLATDLSGRVPGRLGPQHLRQRLARHRARTARRCAADHQRQPVRPLRGSRQSRLDPATGSLSGNWGLASPRGRQERRHRRFRFSDPDRLCAQSLATRPVRDRRAGAAARDRSACRRSCGFPRKRQDPRYAPRRGERAARRVGRPVYGELR
jgi:hypothetical protein